MRNGKSSLNKYVLTLPFNFDRTWLNVSKILLSVGLVGLSITELSLVLKSTDDHPDIDVVTPVVFLASFAVSLLCLLLSLRYGVRTSPLQFFFYLLATVCGAPIIRTLVHRQVERRSIINKLLETF